MIRFFLRIGFWSSLALAAMPSSRVLIMNEGVEPSTLLRAASLATTDIGNFCTRNFGICQTGQAIAAKAGSQARESFLAAYNGIRSQYDQPDRTIMTGSIKQPTKP